MKSIFKLILTLAILFLTSTIYGQEPAKKTKKPRWISDRGFWQIESNIHTPDKNIVYFYNNDKVLIYRENLDGVVLNLRKKSVKMRLKKALETAILAWNKNGKYQNDQQLISVLFNR